jgi:hypothetical protein
MEEEYEIVERVKNWLTTRLLPGDYVMFVDGSVIDESTYDKGVAKPDEVIADIHSFMISSLADFEFPFLCNSSYIIRSYLTKLGFSAVGWIKAKPRTGIKYVIMVLGQGHTFEKVAIELVKLHVVVRNMKLDKIVDQTVGYFPQTVGEPLPADYYFDILKKIDKERLYGGFTENEACNIVQGYYGNERVSSRGNIYNIIRDYVKIFQPYRAVYDTKTWEFIMPF